MKVYDYATTEGDAGYGKEPDPTPPYDDPTWDLRAACMGSSGRILWFWQKEREPSDAAAK
ncbi:MAG: hypothetical protein ACHREM_32605 [Polyangiales bacterium]